MKILRNLILIIVAFPIALVIFGGAETPTQATPAVSKTPIYDAMYPETTKAKAIAKEVKDKENALPVIDETLTDEEKATETKRIVKELKKIPASEFKKNLDLYTKLVAYNPGVERYIKKAGFYKAKWDANQLEIEKKEKAEREERRLAASYPKWSYHSWEESMTSKTAKQASVRTINSLNFGFPYSGSQKATLTIRKHPTYGKDIFISIERGQFMCSTYNNKVLVRFDDTKAQTFRCTEPDDHDSTVIFIRDSQYKRFMARAKKAKKIRIQTNFFQEGVPVMEFYVKGLKF